nr:LytTR family DNA-binding domain-containing protein [uncultured Roseateles sp.]
MAQTPLRVLIVDDEPMARLRLRGLLEDCKEPICEVVAEAGSASQAQHWLSTHACDLVLLDVQMPGPDGMALADAMRQRPNAPAVVFVTAHAEHALRAFELDAIDYLTKPVRRERLAAALARVAQRQAERAAAESQRQTPAEAAEAGVIVINDRGRLVRVPVGEVLYFKAELKYLTLRTATQSFVMDGALSDLEQRLGERFLRVHRNALVAKWAVRELERHAPTEASDVDPGEGAEGWAVRIVGIDEWLAVSRRQVAAVRQALVDQGG